MSLVIHAPNIHQGGGQILLRAVLGAARARNCRIIVDERMKVDDLALDSVAMRVPPSVAGRFRAELMLRELATTASAVLCLGNLPPLFRLRAPVTLFLQNRYLVDRPSFAGFALRERARFAVERAWLRARLSTADEIVVQTPTMARLAERFFGRAAKVLPFVPRDMAAAGQTAKSFDFIYVASDEPHKNHRALIEAWELLARDGIRPSLCLVMGGAGERLMPWLLERVSQGLDVRVETHLERSQVLSLYGRAKALIFPSSMESLGLPLLEAQAAGIPILAPELDYVRDIVDPAQTFDPTSPVSIARAVKRQLDIKDEKTKPISADEFLERVGRSPVATN